MVSSLLLVAVTSQNSYSKTKGRKQKLPPFFIEFRYLEEENPIEALLPRLSVGVTLKETRTHPTCMKRVWAERSVII